MLFLDIDLEKCCEQQKFIEASPDTSVSNNHKDFPLNTNGCYQPDGSFDNYQQLNTSFQGGNKLKLSCAKYYNETAVTSAPPASFAQQPHTYSYMKGKL